MSALLTTWICASFLWAGAHTELTEIYVTTDDVRITESCLVVISPDTVVADTNGNGVIQIVASDIEVTFAPGVRLQGAPHGRRPDTYEGYGVRVDGQSNVTIRNASVRGFRTAIWATDADGLTLEGVDASDNWRSHLKSTPSAEDAGDWLFPHQNDQNEWLTNYAAALYVEDANNVTIHDCRVRDGQNALCMDRVDSAKVYDNDFSFNSGWGMALWRCNESVISRNACDFCIRGYSHGVYNRGQDSAGILMFEQCNRNVIVENSATHGGDGFFGFAGKEALGETGQHPMAWYAARGNTNNLLAHNDFSYAAAHGIEMTFSFANTFYGNRLVENAICGIWGGYSQDTTIAQNRLERNGDMAYGLERGGINIEHSRNNRILANHFQGNRCGVHLWWDPDGGIGKTPWAKANGTETKGNLIACSDFHGDALALHFRGPTEVILADNFFTDIDKTLETDDGVVVRDSDSSKQATPEPQYVVYGENRPVGARAHLRGRRHIIMTEWGPWDHASPLIRVVQDDGHSVRYHLYGLPADTTIAVEGLGVAGELSAPGSQDAPGIYTVSASSDGVHPYRLRAESGDWRKDVSGTLIAATWDVTFFPWDEQTDPREDLQAWRALRQSPGAVSDTIKRLALQYGWGGPSDQGLSDAVKAAKLGTDHFGMIATTRIPLPAGTWEVATLSDDGVRVLADSQTVLENWAWHGPTRDTGTLELPQDKTVEIVVEHFEIDGYATLELDIAKKD